MDAARSPANHSDQRQSISRNFSLKLKMFLGLCTRLDPVLIARPKDTLTVNTSRSLMRALKKGYTMNLTICLINPLITLISINCVYKNISVSN